MATKTNLLKDYFSRLNPFSAPLNRKEPQPSVIRAVDKKSHPSVFTTGTVISGSINSPTDLVILGHVNGDVFSEGDIEVRGEVTGDLTACNVRIYEGKVHGNIRAEKNCQVLRGILEGDIEATLCDIDGTIEGNIMAREELNVHRNSIIRGDISTRILQIEGEAKLTGRVQMEITYTDAMTESALA